MEVIIMSFFAIPITVMKFAYHCNYHHKQEDRVIALKIIGYFWIFLVRPLYIFEKVIGHNVNKPDSALEFVDRQNWAYGVRMGVRGIGNHDHSGEGSGHEQHMWNSVPIQPDTRIIISRLET